MKMHDIFANDGYVFVNPKVVELRDVDGRHVLLKRGAQSYGSKRKLRLVAQFVKGRHGFDNTVSHKLHLH